jgi:hypothetical protein
MGGKILHKNWKSDKSLVELPAELGEQNEIKRCLMHRRVESSMLLPLSCGTKEMIR